MLFRSFHLGVQGRRALDAGASTGGFTQVLLENGAESVIAIDVGYGQLAWELRSNPRVHVRERLNVRYLTIQDLPHRPNLIVADLSFISLTKVIPRLATMSDAEADFLLMVKPQFEAGRDLVASGVVADPIVREQAVIGVIRSGTSSGLLLKGVVASSLPGPKGNVEYFVWMTRSGSDVEGVSEDDESVQTAVKRAIAEGPQ